MFKTASALSTAFTLAGMILAATPAIAAQRWEPAAGGASAILPLPSESRGIVSGSLFCAEQRWAFLLRSERDVPTGAQVRITIDGDVFSQAAQPGMGLLTVGVPNRVVDLLKDGKAVRILVGEGKGALEARFPLSGSRIAIEAAAPRCSLPDVSGLEAVALQAAGPALDAAQPLMERELDLFRQATTGTSPELSAAQVEAEGGDKLLFASLCGSKRYYGESGCKLTGFASEPDGSWRPVYETEGMHLFRDPRVAHSGWPDLVTLPTAGEVRQLRWEWDGQQYQLKDDTAVAGDPPSLDGLRTGATAD